MMFLHKLKNLAMNGKAASKAYWCYQCQSKLCTLYIYLGSRVAAAACPIGLLPLYCLRMAQACSLFLMLYK